MSECRIQAFTDHWWSPGQYSVINIKYGILSPECLKMTLENHKHGRHNANQMNRLFFNTLKFTSRAARTDKRCVANVRLVLYVMIERKIIVHLAKKEQIKYRKEIKIHKNSHMSVYSNIC